jgi:hypothetical protein
MYLIEISKTTGLISEDLTNSGWRAIKDFRNLVDVRGLEALTVVALVKDYQSPLRNYSQEDRPARAMEEIFDNREALDFNNDLLKNALNKYMELQFNIELEQRNLNNEIKIRYVKKIFEANNKEDEVEIEKYTRLLQKHEVSTKAFDQKIDVDELMKKSVTNSGYELTRIENDINSRKNSKFVLHSISKNPDKLKI